MMLDNINIVDGMEQLVEIEAAPLHNQLLTLHLYVLLIGMDAQ